MSDESLDELLRSPFDDDDDRGPVGTPWAALAIGIAAAVLAFIALAVTVGGDSGSPEAVTTTAAGDGAVVEVADPFPVGYTAIADDLAVKAFPPVVDGDRLLVPLAMAVRRGVPPDDVRSLGGVWELATTGGPVASVDLVSDGTFPGAMSIVFPRDGAPGDEIRLVEIWEGDIVGAESEMEFSGSPYALPAPIAHDLGNGVVLTIESVELRNLLAEAVWSVSGTDLAAVDLGLDLLLEDGTLLESYVSGLPDPTLRSSGTIQYVWPLGNRIDPDMASTLRVRATVNLGQRVAAEATVPLPAG